MVRELFLRLTGLVLGLLFIILPSDCVQSQADSRCSRFPQFCVVRVGGLGRMASTGSSRTSLQGAQPQLWPGIVRGMAPDGTFFIGNPAAPIHFLVFHSFTCSHCRGYYQVELTEFIENYVLSGKASLQVGVLAFSMQPYADNAAFASYCAGEQGAFWEMQHALFWQSSTSSPAEAYTIEAIQTIARDLGLDAAHLARCIDSRRYQALLGRHALLATDLGVSATPTVLVSDNFSRRWQKTARNYDNLVQLSDQAAHPR